MNAQIFTFGRIVNGSVTDVCMGPDAATATSQAFAAGYVAQFGGPGSWTQIKSGTAEGSTTSDGVNFQAPPAHQPPSPTVDPIVNLTNLVTALQASVNTVLTQQAAMQSSMAAAAAASPSQAAPPA